LTVLVNLIESDQLNLRIKSSRKKREWLAKTQTDHLADSTASISDLNYQTSSQ
jgi:hypothetical protein